MIKRFLMVVWCAAALLVPQIAFGEESGNPLTGGEITAEAYVQDALDAANRGVEVVFPYAPQQVYQIFLQEGFVTDIRLERKEILRRLDCGDITRWKIDTSTTGSNRSESVTHVLVKPTQRGITTNLIINTNIRTYQLLLVSGERYNPIVSWIFPQSDIGTMAMVICAIIALSLGIAVVTGGTSVVGRNAFKLAVGLTLAIGFILIVNML